MIEKKKILIVEDELEFAELVKARLEMVGYEAAIAVDTYSGTSLALKEDYDLIVLDLMMPAGGGFSMLERLRKFRSMILDIYPNNSHRIHILCDRGHLMSFKKILKK